MAEDHDTQRISDELEIRNLLARLAHLADDGELEESMQLYTEDAVWEGAAGFARLEGHADILAGARERRGSGITGPGAHSRHILTTIDVQVDGSDRARSKSCFMFSADTDTSPSLQAMGVYEDEHRRTADGWKLAHRSIANT